tara:strand:- start:4297 stop:5304 length:1008 start_codon:yes stop_codon:yes gene_type:complete
MLNFGVVLLDNSFCSSVGGIIDVFHLANAHCRSSPQFSREPFRWSLLSDRAGRPVSIAGGLKLVADTSLSSADQFDMIYLPAGTYPGADALESWLGQHTRLLKQLSQLADKGVKIGATCTSTFLLAEAGLLNNRRATTTWWLERKFRARYPHVDLDPRQAMTEDRGIYCSGALNAYHQLALRLVEEHASPEIATLCAKSALINQGQAHQTPYYDLSIPIANEDPLITKAQYWLRNHMRRDVDFTELADDLGTSQRTLIRRFKQATGSTPLKFLQNLRLEASKSLLLNSPLGVNEVMEEVGYSDPSAFIRLFKQRVGLTPSGFRQRFSDASLAQDR